jgi:hypothetical protein
VQQWEAEVADLGEQFVECCLVGDRPGDGGGPAVARSRRGWSVLLAGQRSGDSVGSIKWQATSDVAEQARCPVDA